MTPRGSIDNFNLGWNESKSRDTIWKHYFGAKDALDDLCWLKISLYWSLLMFESVYCWKWGKIPLRHLKPKQPLPPDRFPCQLTDFITSQNLGFFELRSEVCGTIFVDRKAVSIGPDWCLDGSKTVYCWSGATYYTWGFSKEQLQKVEKSYLGQIWWVGCLVVWYIIPNFWPPCLMTNFLRPTFFLLGAPLFFLFFLIISITITITISITITKNKNLVVPSKQMLSSSKFCWKQVVKK